MTDLQHISIPIVNMQNGTATTVFYKYLQSLKSSTQNNGDEEGLIGQNNYNPIDFVLHSDLDHIYQILSGLKSLLSKPSILYISVDTTAVAGAIYICTASLTVTLNSKPEDHETATIATTNGVVTLDGDGKTIIGNSTYSMVADYESKTLLFSSELDGWIFI